MHIEWRVRNRDVRAVQSLINSSVHSTFVRGRVRRNVSGTCTAFSHESFWHVLLGCLLTTQQRSGPGSPVSRFMRSSSCALNLSDCSQLGVGVTVRRELSAFGGIRRAPTIARQAEANYRWLTTEGWDLVADQYERLSRQRARRPRGVDVEAERAAATFIDDHFQGFGPKQSRNLWQWLGLTRYEIPLDSRITKWLNQNVLDLKLSSVLLGDRSYYEFVMDGEEALCERAGVLPCVFDGAIFASFDREWTAAEFRGSA